MEIRKENTQEASADNKDKNCTHNPVLTQIALMNGQINRMSIKELKG